MQIWFSGLSVRINSQDPGFIVQVSNFDLNSTEPILDAPPIPLPPGFFVL